MLMLGEAINVWVYEKSLYLKKKRNFYVRKGEEDRVTITFRCLVYITIYTGMKQQQKNIQG